MPRHGPAPKSPRAHRVGGWLPRDTSLISDFVNRIVKDAKRSPKSLSQGTQELKNLLQNNTTVNMLLRSMLVEVPLAPRYSNSPDNHPEIYDVDTLLQAINYQITNPIIYNDSALIGTPINAILAWPMATASGFTAFLRDDVNQCFEKILKEWGEFLKEERSAETVTTAAGGWLSEQAQNDPHSPGLHDFLKKYQVPDPKDPVHYGFKSWDQFFTRHFLENLRPIASPDDSRVVANAAESTLFSIQHDVQLHDTFWAKDQRYSLVDMLGDRDKAEQFVGGTVYQAFLSADSYHNWHAPVSGKYEATPRIISGTYYSEPVVYGFPNPDIGADANSQGYISCVAKRGVAYIQPDDERLGLIALVMIGMAEVSSIDFDEKSSFKKGDEIGRFHFGGSTHCLIFGPGVKFTPSDNARPVDPEHLGYLNQPPVPVCSEVGRIRFIENCVNELKQSLRSDDLVSTR